MNPFTLIVTVFAAALGTIFLASADESKEAATKGKVDQGKPAEKWIPLFNGKDLTGWTPKIRYHELGKNYANTFRVEDGILKVRYDEKAYEKFGERFGHLFYAKPFSNYRLRVEYRFVGKQVPGGPSWATRNSGIMVHGQDPKSMKKDQDFPNSIEVQLLGGNGKDPRTTVNLCTPGTQVFMEGKLVKRHCTTSKSKTYHGEQWVTVEVEVRGDKVIRHKMGGKVMLEYQLPHLDDGTPLKGGTISLQSESHPVDFRKVEILELKD